MVSFLFVPCFDDNAERLTFQVPVPYIYGTWFIFIIGPADDSAPNGAEPSAGTIVTKI